MYVWSVRLILIWIALWGRVFCTLGGLEALYVGPTPASDISISATFLRMGIIGKWRVGDVGYFLHAFRFIKWSAWAVMEVIDSPTDVYF